MSARGVVWRPPSDGKKVSTTNIGKNVWVQALSKLTNPEAKTLSASLLSEKNWRANYIQYVQRLVELQADASPEEYYASSIAGLDSLNESFDFANAEGDVSTSAIEAMASQAKTNPFTTTEIKGSGAVTSAPFVMKAPCGHAKEYLSGNDMQAQADAWSKYGCIEPSAAASLKAIASNPNADSLVKDKVFVLLGATSALGPFSALSKLGATIVCVARPGKKLDALVEEAKSTPATLLLPTRSDGKTGADLVADAPELAEWLKGLAVDKQLVIGCYVYLDGEAHVRASVAMDLIVKTVCESRGNTAIAQLVSPATPHPVTKESNEASKKRYRNAPLWHGPFRLTGSFVKNSSTAQPNTGLLIVNGLSNVQGPNYALAKISQMWRAAVAKKEGVVSSCNHAPPARTESMVAYKTIAAALEGMQGFDPLVAFDPQTCSDMMAAILLWDLTDDTSGSRPQNKDAHPMDLLVGNACHGGLWGSAYTTESIGKMSFVRGKFVSVYTPKGCIGK